MIDILKLADALDEEANEFVYGTVNFRLIKVISRAIRKSVVQYDLAESSVADFNMRQQRLDAQKKDYFDGV